MQRHGKMARSWREGAAMADEAETIILRDGGRIVIPASIRTALGLRTGDALIARIEDGELRLTLRKAQIARVQAMLRPFKRPCVDEVDAFLAERRAMWGEG
jgi:AbrB family looped-hinge helix DNA binding protein